MTTAPDYLLNSSLLKDERLIDKNNTALHWEELSVCKGLRTAAQVPVCKSSTQDGRDVKFAKTENALLKSQLASSLTENRLLAQWSAACLTSSSTVQLPHLGMKQSFHLESTYDNQEMSQLCLTSSLTLASKEKFAGMCATDSPVLVSLPVGIKSTVGGSKCAKKHAVERKARDTKGTSVAVKPKPVKKVKLAVPEQANNVVHVSNFEPPTYQLIHEHVEREKVVLFVPPEKEEIAERLMRRVVDVQSVKVITKLLLINLFYITA